MFFRKRKNREEEKPIIIVLSDLVRALKQQLETLVIDVEGIKQRFKKKIPVEKTEEDIKIPVENPIKDGFDDLRELRKKGYT